MPQLRRQTPVAKFGDIQVNRQDTLFAPDVSIPSVNPASSPFRTQLRPSIKRDFWLSAEKSLMHREYGFIALVVRQGFLNGSDIKAPVSGNF